MLKFLFFLLVIKFTSSETADYIITRIVGGVNVTIQEVPWQVAVHYYPINLCGGAIINTDTILTAAHCFVNRTDPKAFQVRVGATRRSVGGKLYKVKHITIHPKFDRTTYFYDIAIIKLNKALEFNSKVRPIRLPAQKEPLPIGEYGMVTGWGRIRHQGSFPKVLQKVYLPILAQKVCRKAYDGVAVITDQMFCAGTLDGLKDACNGDSGGPFVVRNKLFGLVSSGIKCASETYPGIFTAINKLRNWIDKNI